jgi:adenine-specific DNA-methyltransferase
MSFRYIGSKARFAEEIGQYINDWDGSGRFIDAFCGTGVVSEVAAAAGWPVHLNDSLSCATTMASARLIARSQAKFRSLGGYRKAIEALNEAPAIRGFIWREYSPASEPYIGIQRRYFREENAGRIDAIRAMIRTWRNEHRITEVEERLLIADLLAAATRVANIAGTYGCFLSKWTSQADEHLTLRARRLAAATVDVTITTDDVANLAVDADDLVYLDPPYTKRQYASYYHLLETITLGDEPIVEGVGGLRPWRDRASDFCYKTRALAALFSLIEHLNSRRVLLSYSDDAHVPIRDLRAMLRGLGVVESHVVQTVGRYRPNHAASLGLSEVREYIFVLTRDEDAVAEALSA